ncbi:AGRE3 protein, partial [Atractosteus spatula]|nr:AGRE3 protein [Atractosteus spatula]
LSVRLVNGSHDCEGRVEINRWAVSDVGWDDQDAEVVCRELGCVQSAKGKTLFVQVPYSPMITDVQCSGNETSLLQCRYATNFFYGNHTSGVVCSAFEDLLVYFTLSCRSCLSDFLFENRLKWFVWLEIYTFSPWYLQHVVEHLSSLLNKIERLSNLTIQERMIAGEIVLQNVENITIPMSDTSDEFMKKNMTLFSLFELWRFKQPGITSGLKVTELTELQQQMTIPLECVLFASYTGLESILDGTFFQANSSEDFSPVLPTVSPQINSHIVTVVINQKMNQIHKLLQPVNVTFQNKQKKSNKNTLFCVYWKSEGNESFWSRGGLKVTHSNETHTVCSSYHLSSCAVIITANTKKIEEDSVLSVINHVFVITNLICLCLAIITFVFCKSAHNTIHLHLSLCLFMAHLLFLTGGYKTDYEVICAVIAGVLHFLFLASFVWMCLEGVQLLLLVTNLRVVKYSSRSRLTKRYLFPPGYGIPAMIVVVSAGVFPQVRSCWLSCEKSFKWSFLGPVSFLIAVNIILFAFILQTLRSQLSFLNTDISKVRNTRLLTFKSMAQFIIMGCSWILGFFQEDVFFRYAFVIINSLQGPFIFLVHCVLNQQVTSNRQSNVPLQNVCNFSL